jgi:hypothetical protein
VRDSRRERQPVRCWRARDVRDRRGPNGGRQPRRSPRPLVETTARAATHRPSGALHGAATEREPRVISSRAYATPVRRTSAAPGAGGPGRPRCTGCTRRMPPSRRRTDLGGAWASSTLPDPRGMQRQPPTARDRSRTDSCRRSCRRTAPRGRPGRPGARSPCVASYRSCMNGSATSRRVRRGAPACQLPQAASDAVARGIGACQPTPLDELVASRYGRWTPAAPLMRAGRPSGQLRLSWARKRPASETTLADHRPSLPLVLPPATGSCVPAPSAGQGGSGPGHSH